MIRRLLMGAAALVAMAVAVPSVGAITRGGELDGEDHPYVGLMVAWDGEVALGRCTGSLISSTVFVTAGHCTFGADRIEIWFDSDVESGIPGNGYPGSGTASGTPYTHPDYNDAAFYLADLGVVVLDEAVEMDRYAQLPSAGYVDTLARGRKSPGVTAVGYGLQQIISNPVKGEIKVQADRVRYQANLMIVNTKGAAGIGSLPGSNSMIVSGDAKHGGTCFGDSGGPMLVGDTVVAVNSFGLNGNCAGVGGVYRIDRQFELDWITGFLEKAETD